VRRRSEDWPPQRRSWSGRLRGQIAFALRRGSDAPPLLLRAAGQLEPIDASLSRDTYLEALFAAISVGRFGGEDGLPKMAEAARAAPAPTTPPQATDVLFDGLVVRFTEGYMAAAPLLKRAPAAFRRESATTGGDVRSLRLAIDLWDDDAWHELAARQVEFARDTGALTVMPSALNSFAAFHLWAGDLAAAAALTEEARAITEESGIPRADGVSLGLASFRGRQDVVLELVEWSRREAAARGEGSAITMAEFRVHRPCQMGFGRYQEALTPDVNGAERNRRLDDHSQ
jgi:hypothetical protein